MTGLCECGCGDPARIAERTHSREGVFKGEPLRFLRGHQTRVMRKHHPTLICAWCGEPFVVMPYRIKEGASYCSVTCSSAAKAGERHPNYKGGLCFSGGRWRVWCRDGTVVLYSRAVMAAKIGRLLRPDEIVHHENEDPSDDGEENLRIVTYAEHLELHRGGHDRSRVAERAQATRRARAA
jgi:hypothetical protein